MRMCCCMNWRSQATGFVCRKMQRYNSKQVLNTSSFLRPSVFHKFDANEYMSRVNIVIYRDIMMMMFKKSILLVITEFTSILLLTLFSSQKGTIFLPGHTHEALEGGPNIEAYLSSVQNICIKKFVSFRKYLNLALCGYSCPRLRQ